MRAIPKSRIRSVPWSSTIRFGRLDVAVNQAGTVGMRKAAAELFRQVQLHPESHRFGSFNHRAERFAGHELHGDERVPLVFADVEDGDDVGVFETAGRARFLHEPRADVAVLELVADQFDGERTPEHRVLGQIQAAHAALAQEPLDLVSSNSRRERLRVCHHRRL